MEFSNFSTKPSYQVLHALNSIYNSTTNSILAGVIMANMLASRRNRIAKGVDNPINDDGFWQFRRFKGNRKAGSPTGGRGWRRNLRAKEKAEFKRSIPEL